MSESRKVFRDYRAEARQHAGWKCWKLYADSRLIQLAAMRLSQMLLRFNLQFVWWGFGSLYFAFRRFRHPEAYRLIYRWGLFLGIFEIRCWSVRAKSLTRDDMISIIFAEAVQ